MYNPEMLKELGITRFRRNGLALAKDLINVLHWEKKNSKCAWLTVCHKTGCGRTVEFRKKTEDISISVQYVDILVTLMRSTEKLFLGFNS